MSALPAEKAANNKVAHHTIEELLHTTAQLLGKEHVTCTSSLHTSTHGSSYPLLMLSYVEKSNKQYQKQNMCKTQDVAKRISCLRREPT